MDIPITPDVFEGLAGKKVLVVEDDTLLHDLLANKLSGLRSHGLEVHPAFNGAEAMEDAKKVKPDLIILDLMLPGVTGFEFLEALRKEEDIKDTKVIIFSNVNQEGDREKARMLGVKEYLVKADTSLDDIPSKVVHLLKS